MCQIKDVPWPKAISAHCITWYKHLRKNATGKVDIGHNDLHNQYLQDWRGVKSTSVSSLLLNRRMSGQQDDSLSATKYEIDLQTAFQKEIRE